MKCRFSNGTVKWFDPSLRELLDRPTRDTPLEEFAMWWLNYGLHNPPQFGYPLDFNGNLHGVVLYRDGQYQVQLFTVAPHSKIIEHRHPNVDTYELFFSGEFYFTINGKKQFRLDSCLHENPNGIPPFCGWASHIGPEDWHSGVFGAMGGCFISIQRWLNGVPPTSVGHDWLEKGSDEPAPLEQLRVPGMP